MMNAKNFEELLIAVKGKDMAEVQGEEVKRVLKELLVGEFAGIRERKFKVILKKPSGGGLASINKVDGKVFLWIDPDFNQKSLAALLRHELLHLELGLPDDWDPYFKAAARRRKIDIWLV